MVSAPWFVWAFFLVLYAPWIGLVGMLILEAFGWDPKFDGVQPTPRREPTKQEKIQAEVDQLTEFYANMQKHGAI